MADTVENSHEREMSVEDVDFDVRKQTARLLNFIARLRSVWRVLPAIFVTVLLFQVYLFYTCHARYRAEATIGPPNPSPASTLFFGSSSGVSSLLKRGNSTGDSYPIFRQLLISDRLSTALADTPGALRTIFPDRWDATNGAWRPPSLKRKLVESVKYLFRRPTFYYPNATVLAAYLDKHLEIDSAKNVAISDMALSAMGSGSNYMTLSIDAESPESAEKILNLILDKADSLVRSELLRDVNARIDYIGKTLPNITQTDQRDSLIQLLSEQEQIKVMLVSDKRFAYFMISPPYASPVPFLPESFLKYLLFAILSTLVLWILLGWLEMHSSAVRKLLNPFRN